MSSAEHTHHVPLPLEVTKAQLHSASYLESRMPDAIRLDFRNLDGDMLVRDSEVVIATDMAAIHEEWPSFNRTISKFLQYSGVGASLTMTMQGPQPAMTRLSAFQQPIGRVGLSYEFSDLDASRTAIRTVLEVPRAIKADWILQLGTRHLISHLLPEAVSAEPSAAS